MSNIYATPTADLAIHPQYDAAINYDYFIVSQRKLIIMVILTAGLYLVYWNFKQWKCIQQQDQSGIFPILRAIFSPLFIYALFQRINDDAISQNSNNYWRYGLAALCYIILSFSPFLLSIGITQYYEFVGTPELLAKSTLYVFSIVLGYVFSALVIITITKAQSLTNTMANNPTGSENSQLTWQNYFWIAAGLAIMFIEFYFVFSNYFA